jgi:hypothetical protein
LSGSFFGSFLEKQKRTRKEKRLSNQNTPALLPIFSYQITTNMKTLLCIILLAIITFSCQKEISQESVVATLSTLTTTAPTSITATTATSGGNITNDGGATITARGVCWSTSTNPVVTGNHTTDGTGSGVFASNITSLTISTTYYVRAYATNSAGTAYGNEISFTTTNTSTALPTVTTTSLLAITMTTATSGGNVVADGGAAVTARGVCWSTTANPTIALSTKTTNGTGTGIFTSALTGLTAATTYHVRAYATNSVGTSYGGDSVFTTASTSTIPTITTTAISAITNTTANSGGTISTDGGAAVTARGVCWSLTPNPTIALSTKTTDGTGIGTFTSSITGLTASTTYHVRAYATNSVGTAYGNDLSFTTTGSSTPDVYIVGRERNGTTADVAMLWKNGVAIPLTNGINHAEALSVFVYGTDVYICGWASNGTTDVATLWKNGVATALTNSANNSKANSVFVSGTDVYVCGWANNGTTNVATLWKNGVATSLTSTFNAMAYSVFVLGTDVYVGGTEAPGPKNVAKLWKNGVATSLTNGTENAAAYSVFVSGSDVYVAGLEYNSPTVALNTKLWKNGVSTTLSIYTQGGGPSVFASGADVYVAGNDMHPNPTYHSEATLWKNGVATSLTSGPFNGVASSVFVLGSDVYVTGWESGAFPTKEIVKLWKNGVVTSITDGSKVDWAYAIFVK